MIVFIAVAMTVLLGFAGYATDTGTIWVFRTHLQNSVDAGVLAAAQELPDDTSASAVACEYATEHNAVPGMFGKIETCSGEADVTFEDEGYTIRVKAYRTVQPTFGQILGFEPVEVWAEAKATVGSLGAACLFPFFITENVLTDNPDFYAPVTFTDSSFNDDDGGAIFIDRGAAGIRNAMVETTCTGDDPTTDAGAVGDSVPTKPGALDQFWQGWRDITVLAETSACSDKYVSTYLNEENELDLTPAEIADCPRLVVIPVLENGDYSGGKASGKIVGFIPFYFALRCDSNDCIDPDVGALTKNDFWGYFVRLDVAGLGWTEYDPTFGTRIVALAD